MKINKVKSLGSKNKEVRYGDLLPSDCFLAYPGDDTIRMKTDQGNYCFRERMHFLDNDGAYSTDAIIIPVEVEINWCYKEPTQ
ncbi:hypothetical protein LCGC14_0650320 [marine sediment metagenome]|uniref:Uncharacterized protein n=1 Tax=marine sediment metagenome TaxID=412755 RepID=A0A0F9U4W6_9ZZZZ|nr:hypothetical protein [Candidatus Aminicenantes bacterium]